MVYSAYMIVLYLYDCFCFGFITNIDLFCFGFITNNAYLYIIIHLVTI